MRQQEIRAGEEKEENIECSGETVDKFHYKCYGMIVASGTAETRFEADHTEWKGGKCENDGVGNHSDGSPSVIYIRINVLLCIDTSLRSKFPPMLFTNGDVAPGPEEQRSVC